jgi:hypothetical protein
MGHSYDQKVHRKIWSEGLGHLEIYAEESSGSLRWEVQALAEGTYEATYFCHLARQKG